MEGGREARRGGASRLWGCPSGPGSYGQLLVLCSPVWSLWDLEACERSDKWDLWGSQNKTLCPAVCNLSLPPWCGQCGSIHPSKNPVLPSEAAPASSLTLLLSRLSCVLALGFGVSTSAFLCLCLCPCLSLFSLLLLAPVDIKVIKDLPWPPPVGQLDSSPSLPDGDRDISGPASPLLESSLEDSSGGSCGDFWPG